MYPRFLRYPRMFRYKPFLHYLYRNFYQTSIKKGFKENKQLNSWNIRSFPFAKSFSSGICLILLKWLKKPCLINLLHLSNSRHLLDDNSFDWRIKDKAFLQHGIKSFVRKIVKSPIIRSKSQVVEFNSERLNKSKK